MSSSSELLKNLLILQHEAVKALVAEYHQHTEAYVQQFGQLPLSQEPAQAAHDARIALRSSTSASPSLADGCAVSDVILAATKQHCDVDMSAASADSLEAFLATSRRDVKTTEDRVHALFVLDASLAKAQTHKELQMQQRFEGKQGYDLLVEWLAVSCSYSDDTSKAFTELLLLVLQRHAPAMSFTTKTVVKSLAQYKKVIKSKANKTLLLSVIRQYREKINQ
ncbi:Histone-lysine N-methyltransferase [Phytophthora cinnamomi]|uniref:Histone-lysine N-methyltransferase n=1 Tax=Phytophthora cinnamomi TaxID=4785 RepID=UPI0035596493|nr:Histone-lysine N-methyltransferase [Phytophthora cinnamomi]